MEGLQKKEIIQEQKSFKRGEVVGLRKVHINEGLDSEVKRGNVLYGRLTSDVRVGDSARLSDGSQTSTIKNIYQKDGKTFLETQTSVYEIYPNEISDLNIENELGEIHLPEDAKLAELNAEILDQKFKSPDKLFEFYINYDALKGVLLEVNGGELFKGGGDMQGRLFVVCKVGNIHIPFYKSSEGASGKIEGEWYPFFGATPGWIIKGGVNKETGEMYYNDKISGVQKLLNENLKIPSSSYISPRGVFGSGRGNNPEPTKVWLDLNAHIKYQNGYFFERETGKDHTKLVTGYDPKNVSNDGKGSAQKWIDDVVSSIK